MLAPHQRLTFPCGRRPRFNPLHVAARSTRISGIHSGKDGFINSVTGAAWTRTGTPSATVDSVIGPCADYINNSSNNKFALPVVSPSNITAAAIVRNNTLLAANNYINIFAVNGGHQTGQTALYWNGPNLDWYRNADVIMSFSASSGVPYFVAVSMNYANGDVDFVVTNLITGRIVSESTTVVCSTDTDDELWLGGDGFSGDTSQSPKIAAMMYSHARTPLVSLIQWAADPWSFWYETERELPSFSGRGLYTQIDEPQPVIDADFIKSGLDPQNDIARFTLTNPPTGKRLRDPFKVRYRYKKSDTGSVNVTVTLKQGATQIAQWVHTDATTSYQTAEQTITGSEYAAITDWNDLRLELNADLP